MMKPIKRMLTCLLVMLLLPASVLAQEDVYDLVENALYRIVLRTGEEDIPLGSGVLFVEQRLLLCPANCAREGALYAIGTDGEHAIATADALADSGLAALEMATPSANTPLQLASEEANGLACVFAMDAKGQPIVAPLHQVRDALYHGQEALLLSAAEGLLPGGILTDEEGHLIGMTIAQHAEGNGAYLALDANTVYRALSRQQYADFFLPVDALWQDGVLTLTWEDDARTDGLYLITLASDDNEYYTFFQAALDERTMELIAPPGHRYYFQVQWVSDLQSGLEPVWGAMSAAIVPDASFTRYGYAQTSVLVSRTSPTDHLQPLPDTSLARMGDTSLLHYLQVTATYDVEEAVELPMTIELFSPDGQFYFESALCTLSPQKEKKDAFLLPLDAMLADCQEFSGGDLTLGDYTIRYALAGAVAGEYTFTITEKTAEEIAAEEAAAAEAARNMPKVGLVTQLKADYASGAVALSWPSEEIPEGAMVNVFYLYDGNAYYVYQQMQAGETETEIFTVPGRSTMIWVGWTLDATLEIPMPEHEHDFLIIPAAPEEPFTLHGFANQRLGVAASTDPLAVDKGEFLPETPLTREILTNAENFLYFQTEDTYQIAEDSDDHPMMIVLCTPEGLCFADPLIYMFDTDLQSSDLWLKDISNLCRDYESLICGAWPAGEYRILYCIDGQVAGEIRFTLGEP